MTKQKLSDVNWQPEMERVILRYHTITSWVAIIFDLLFFITDYININERWQEFFIFRAAVSFIMLIVVITHKRFKIPIEIIGVIPVLLISIQNAYMWSVMDIEHLQKHTFAYIALFIGSGMLVLYRTFYSIIIVVVSLIANIIFFKLNSTLTIDEILVNGGLLTAAVGIFSILLIRTRFNLTRKEIIARLSLKKSNKELAIKNEIIEEKNKNITDSINYAYRIQQAILPRSEKIAESMPHTFIIYKPKDIVSGDFYWFYDMDELHAFVAVVDCTGHGVPGAFMSMIGSNILNQLMSFSVISKPSELLNRLHEEVTKALKQNLPGSESKDGMDIALCRFNKKTNKLDYAGANRPLYLFRNKELIEISPDKKSIGGNHGATSTGFTNHQVELQKGDTVYMTTDGYIDQFGGPNGKKFMAKKFRDLLSGIQHLSMQEQKDAIEKAYEEWKGGLEQIDDVLVIGVKI